VADVRSDIYSLGAVGYFLLSGQSPFSGEGMQRLRSSLVEEPTPLAERNSDVPADLQAVIHRCLRRDPEERFADVQALDKALADCVCAASWSSGEAATWWQTAGVAPMVGTEFGGATPGRANGGKKNGTC
jgi:serine/threonine protein kinase